MARSEGCEVVPSGKVIFQMLKKYLHHWNQFGWFQYQKRLQDRVRLRMHRYGIKELLGITWLSIKCVEHHALFPPSFCRWYTCGKVTCHTSRQQIPLFFQLGLDRPPALWHKNRISPLVFSIPLNLTTLKLN